MDTTIPDELKQTADKGNFLTFLDWVDESKKACMVIFLSDWAATILKNSEMWYCDGNFSITPEPFKQVYIIMTQVQGNNNDNPIGVPCGFALLPNKEKKTYELFFAKIKEKVQPTHLKEIVTDFERAVISAIATVS